MDRVPVQSSNLESVGYDAPLKTLEVKFRSGAVYCYSDVPAEIHTRLMASPSKGSYLAQHIRPYYPVRKLDAAEAEG